MISRVAVEYIFCNGNAVGAVRIRHRNSSSNWTVPDSRVLLLLSILTDLNEVQARRITSTPIGVLLKNMADSMYTHLLSLSLTPDLTASRRGSR